MLALAPTAPSTTAQRRRLTSTPDTVGPAGAADPTGIDRLASRHRPGTATIEELVARDIEAFSARPRLTLRPRV